VWRCLVWDCDDLAVEWEVREVEGEGVVLLAVADDADTDDADTDDADTDDADTDDADTDDEVGVAAVSAAEVVVARKAWIE
jgi:hypothetical protein